MDSSTCPHRARTFDTGHAGTRILLQKILASSLATLLAVGIGEVMVRIFCNPNDLLLVRVVPDRILGHRYTPLAAGHDANGFRNRSVPRHAPIVTIGDSMTYGTSALCRHSWPVQLGALSGVPVYNMGVGGYCPLDYAHLVRTLVPSLSPQLVIIGLYFGNDFLDCYNAVYIQGRYRDFANETSSTPVVPWTVGPVPPAPADNPALPLHFRHIRTWLAENSMLYGLIKSRTRDTLLTWESRAFAKTDAPDAFVSWEDPARPAIRTKFAPLGRLAAVDLERPSVVEGLRLAREAILQIASDLAAGERRMLVVLIPTKELVYEPLFNERGGDVSETMRATWHREKELRGIVKDFLAEHGIDCIDSLGGLQAAVHEGRQMYPWGTDGHPMHAGYREIAEIVNESDAVRSLAGRTSPRPEDLE